MIQVKINFKLVDKIVKDAAVFDKTKGLEFVTGKLIDRFCKGDKPEVKQKYFAVVLGKLKSQEKKEREKPIFSEEERERMIKDAELKALREGHHNLK